jgi:hypothetical protein
MRLSAIFLSLAALCVVSPAEATTCPAEAGIRADPRWRDRGCHLCVIVRVYVGPGMALHWNGATRDLPAIRRYLAITRTLNPEPFIELVIRRGAHCGTIGAIRETIQQELPCDNWGCTYALVPDRPRPRRTVPPLD